MNYLVCSVFDIKSGVYAQPFYSANLIVATRSFRMLVNDGQSIVSRSPEDFQLHKVGEFDDQSGVLKGDAQPVFVTNAVNLKE